MPRRIAQLLLALMIALSAVLPLRAETMAMPAGMRMAMPCNGCQPHQGAARMSPCQGIVCPAAVATLPAVAVAPVAQFGRAEYATALPVRWTEAAPAPDPLPPRTIPLA